MSEFPSVFSVDAFGRTLYLFRAQQGPTELPGLRGDLGLHEPFLGQILVFNIRVVVQLVERLQIIRRRRVMRSVHSAVLCTDDIVAALRCYQNGNI